MTISVLQNFKFDSDYETVRSMRYDESNETKGILVQGTMREVCGKREEESYCI